MDFNTILIAGLGALVAGLIQGLTGFAFAVVAMTVWVWFLDPVLSAVLAVFGAFFGQIIGIFLLGNRIQLNGVIPFIIGGLIGIPIGYQLLPFFNTTYLKLGLGIILLVISPVLLLSRKLPTVTLGGKWLDGIIGFIGGILGVLAGLSGVLPALWCVLKGYEKALQRAILQYYNLVILTITAIIYIFSGIVQFSMLPAVGVVVIALFIPVLLGARLYVKINERLFQAIVLQILFLMGIVLIVSAL